MAIFKNAEERLAENYVYELVAKELQDGFRKDGLWLRAATESEDDEQKARRLYVRYRVQEIKDELDLEAQREAATASQGVRQRDGGSAQSPEPLESDAGPRSVGWLFLWLFAAFFIFIIVIQVSMSPLFN